ncbi:MAG: hypothetical protein AB1700_19305, partial [Bacillota bacterium]
MAAAVVMLIAVTQSSAITVQSSLLFFGALSAFAAFFPVPLPRGGSVSVSFATNFAAVLVCGPLAAWVGVIDGVANAIRRRPGFLKASFNIAQMVITVGAAGLAYRWAGGYVGQPHLPEDAVPVLAGALAYFLVNASLVTGVISISQALPFRVVWSANIRTTIRNYLALAPLGFLIA